MSLLWEVFMYGWETKNECILVMFLPFAGALLVCLYVIYDACDIGLRKALQKRRKDTWIVRLKKLYHKKPCHRAMIYYSCAQELKKVQTSPLLRPSVMPEECQT